MGRDVTAPKCDRIGQTVTRKEALQGVEVAKVQEDKARLGAKRNSGAKASPGMANYGDVGNDNKIIIDNLPCWRKTLVDNLTASRIIGRFHFIEESCFRVGIIKKAMISRRHSSSMHDMWTE
jgi:hypothetical protein